MGRAGSTIKSLAGTIKQDLIPCGASTLKGPISIYLSERGQTLRQDPRRGPNQEVSLKFENLSLKPYLK
jgi:hypothetical protein